MSVIFVLVPLAVLMAAGAVGAFILAVRRGQFDDLETPAMRVIAEDAAPASGSPGRTSEGSR